MKEHNIPTIALRLFLCNLKLHVMQNVKVKLTMYIQNKYETLKIFGVSLTI